MTGDNVNQTPSEKGKDTPQVQGHDAARDEATKKDAGALASVKDRPGGGSVTLPDVRLDPIATASTNIHDAAHQRSLMGYGAAKPDVNRIINILEPLKA